MNIIRFSKGVLNCVVYPIILLHTPLAQSQPTKNSTIIDLPQTPNRPNNYQYSNDDFKKDLMELKRRRLKREKDANQPESPEKARNRKLSEESRKPRPYEFFLQLSLVSTKVNVTAPRKDYQSDLTSHIQALFRITEGKPNELHWWWGFRIAPFAGSGIYEETPGRFGFIYSGPSFGLGSINVSEQDTEKNPYRLKTGWLWTWGIAAQTRRAELDPSGEPPEKDINTSDGIEFDAPGVWTEFSIMTIHFGALAWNFVGGAQLGEGKTFMWFGVGAAGFY